MKDAVYACESMSDAQPFRPWSRSALREAMAITSARARARRVLCLFALLFAAACADSLDPSLEGKRCSSTGECLAGYRCSPSNECVRADSIERDSQRSDQAGSIDGSPATSAFADSGLVEADGADGAAQRPPAPDAASDEQAGSAGASATAGHGSGAQAPDVGAAGGASAAESGGGTAGSADAPVAGDSGGGQASGNAGPPASMAGEPAAGASGGEAEPPLPIAGASGGCSSELSLCAGACVDLERDVANCGECGRACNAEGGSAVCEEGSCGIRCGSGLTTCGDYCVDTANDPRDCGACGNACSSSQSCRESRCESDGLDVEAARHLFSDHGVDLDLLARRSNIDLDRLEGAHVTLADLQRIGLDYQRLRQLGITLEELESVGVDVGAAGRGD
jgi:hypothetical protein